MGVPFDYAPDRPESIQQILNSLERYNPETTTIFQEYVMQQCEQQTYDCYANLALLKLYQFNPHLLKDESVTNILVKSLTVFPSPDFSLCLALLPPHILLPPAKASAAAANNPVAGDAPFYEAVQKLTVLHRQLSGAQYADFWTTLDGDDLYADLVADVTGFEELMRVRVAVAVSQCVREISRPVLEGWLNLRTAPFDKFVKEVCGWEIVGEGKDASVKVPLNKENEAKSVVVRENVKFEQFGRLVRRAYEQPV